MGAKALKVWLTHSHLYKAGYCYYYVTNFRWIFYAHLTNFPVNIKFLSSYEASRMV